MIKAFSVRIANTSICLQTKEIATKVGSRHGKPYVLGIDCKRMVSDGIKFYLSRNGVWLTKHVDPKYLLTI